MEVPARLDELQLRRAVRAVRTILDNGGRPMDIKEEAHWACRQLSPEQMADADDEFVEEIVAAMPWQLGADKAAVRRLAHEEFAYCRALLVLKQLEVLAAEHKPLPPRRANLAAYFPAAETL